MNGLVYTKEGFRSHKKMESIKEVIKSALLGAFAGIVLVVIFLLGYYIGDSIRNHFESTETAWNLQLVNAENIVPESYKVELVLLRNGEAVDRRIYADLQQMMDDARAEGLSPLICSSYRSHEDQIGLFNNEVSQFEAQGYSREEAKTKAAEWVAIPGTSEHELGLAVDIVAESNQMLDTSQEQTPEQQWLMANSYKYGFILRYPTDKSEITGIGYEPWHYRYVGKEAATEITQQKLCLEEYLESSLY